MNKFYLNAIMGIGLAGIVSVAGLFVTPLFIVYFFPDQGQNAWAYDVPERLYQINLDYHNYTDLALPIVYLSVNYRAYNSSKLNHPDPYFTGIFVTRRSLDKDQYLHNDTMWKIHAFQGLEYNEWNVADTYGTHEPEIYVHHSYIAYEVVTFSVLLLAALSEAREVNIQDYNYPEEINGTNDYIIPGNWDLSVTIVFENATSINLYAHQDGWLEHVRSNCIAWATTEEGLTACLGSAGEPVIYKEYGSSFNTFHQVFGEYAREHVQLISSG